MSALTIAGNGIRTDAEGRYCVNDLHRAAGGESRHRPGYWLEQDQTKALAAEIEIAGIPAIWKKPKVGTFVAREMVYAFAMWISPAFSLQVIRSFDSLTNAKPQQDIQDALNNPETLRALLANNVDARLRLTEETARLQDEVDRQAPRAAAFDRLAASKGAMSLRAAARVLGIKPYQFNDWLSSLNWIYRAGDSGGWMGAAQRCNSGHLEHRLYLPENSHRHRVQVLVTIGGLVRLSQLLEAASMPTALNPTPAMSVRQPRRSSHV